MRTNIKVFFSLFILIGMIVSSSCVKEKFDEPQVDSPSDVTSGLTPNITVQDIKNMYDTLTVVDGNVKTFTTDLVLEAKVISTDQLGNFYKELYVEDTTGGLVLSIDGSNLFNDFDLGQTVHIKLNGLNINYDLSFKAIVELGFGLFNDGGENKLGRIPVSILNDYVFKEGAPSTPSSTTITLDDNYLTDNNVGKFVKIENTQFISSDTNATYADAVAQERQSLNLESCSGSTQLILLTSGYAIFAGTKVPTGNGTIEGVLTKYGSQGYQLVINTNNDVNFSGARCDDGGGTDPGEGTGTGTKDDPYDVAAAISLNNSATSVWVKGFLIGIMDTQGSEFVADLTAPFATNSNVYIAPSANETDTAKMLIIQLPSGDIRTNTNLVDNENLLGSEIMYHGDLMDYFDIPGMKNTNGYWLNGAGVDPDLPASVVIIGTSQIVSSLNETFDSSTPDADYNLNGWLNANKQGERYWIGKEYTSENNKYLQFSGYTATYSTLESWLVSPGVTASTNKKLSFRTKTGYYKHDALTVYISTDFDGNNSNLFTSTWTDITSSTTIATGPDDGYGAWVVSGDIDLSAYTGSTIYVMFKYTGDNSTNTTTMQIDDVVITDL